MGQCTSSKDLWLKLEKVYQDKEDNSINDSEGKDSPKSSNFNTPNEVEYSLTNEEEDIVEFFVDEEEEMLKFKENVLSDLGDVSMEIGHYSITSEYLEKYINEVLEKYPKHIMELKKILKEREESKKTQFEEKEEEIKRLNDEIIIQEEEKKKVYDEIRKSVEVNFNLKTQIEEAKRIEELLKNQVNEKEES
jgi:hypothetical protein